MKKQHTEEASGKIPLVTHNYSYQPTSDPHLFRFVDRDGNWTHYWQDELKRFLPAVNHVTKTAFNKGVGFHSWLLSRSKEEAERILATTGEEGARTHDAIRDLLAGVRVDEEKKYWNETEKRFQILTGDEWDNLVSWAAWVEQFEPRTIAAEFSVYCSEKGQEQAGTLDWLGTINYAGSRLVVLLDWKTGSKIHFEHGINNEFYAQGLIETIEKRPYLIRDMLGLDPKSLPAPELTGVVRLGTQHQNGGFEMKLWSDKDRMKFRKARDSVRTIYGIVEKEFEPEIREIPTHLQIRIPKWEPEKVKVKKEKNNVPAKRKRNEGNRRHMPGVQPPLLSGGHRRGKSR